MPALPVPASAYDALDTDASARARLRAEEDERWMPEAIGGVRLTRLLGQGGMGRVYLGFHPTFGCEVAVKIIPDLIEDRARFFSEARLAAQVQHPHVVRLYNAGIEQRRCFLVMELLPGDTLKALIERSPLRWRDAAAYLVQAAQGLAALHERGIVHRDVKPSNLLLDAANQVKLADLGVARGIIDDGNHTATGGAIGTAAYMAPEQGQDARLVTPAADIYALGVTFYQMLTGRLPFSGMGFTDLLITHRTQPLPDVRLAVPDLPEPVAAYLDRMTAKHPQDRPQDGKTVARELEEIVAQITVSTRVRSGRHVLLLQSMRRHWPWAAAAAALLALAAGLPLALDAASDPPAPPQAAAAPPVPLPAPVAAAPAPADVWQTPPRAVFILASQVPAGALAAIDSACQASGLPVVDRQHLETLVREQDLAAAGRTDPATAGRIGRLVGGHIALFATALDDRIELRTVVVETGEVVASRFVTPAEAGASAAEGIATASALLPVQGRIAAQAGTLALSAGTRHGVRIGNRFALRRIIDGPDVCTATVTAVERERATLTAVPARDDAAGLLAVRLTP